MNEIQNLEINQPSHNLYEVAKDFLEFIGLSIVGIIGLVALPIIAAIGTPICILKGMYHNSMMIYHWEHTRETDENGNFIDDTELSYSTENNPKNYDEISKFTTRKDMIRLQHEIDRLYHSDACLKSLQWTTALIICIVPAFGLAAFALKEASRPESSLFKERNMDSENKIENHLKQLRKKFDNLDALNETLHKPTDTVFENVPSDLHSIMGSYLEAVYNPAPTPNPYPANSGTS